MQTRCIMGDMQMSNTSLKGIGGSAMGYRINLNYQTELNCRGTQTKTRNMNGEKQN